MIQSIRYSFRVALALLVSTLIAASSLRAHEVQPTVADLTIGADRAEITLDWVLEAPVAGIDLDGLEDTNAAENAGSYDALRADPPEALADDFREAWPQISQNMTLKAGDEALALSLDAVDVPDEPNLQLARVSRVTLSAQLPEGDAPLSFSWPAEYGPLVFRQQGIEDGYTAYLISGGTTDPIPRTGVEEQGAAAAFVEYISVGFDHIIPKGLDHILFVLGLFFLSLNMRPLLWQVTAFTAAHTVTLALGSLGIIRISPEIVEPLIAASIVYVGVENVLARGLTPWRPVVVFCFGLLHGLGFASVLSDFGLGSSHFFPKLIGFNVGVEFGQLAVIATAFLAFGIIFGNAPWYRRRIAGPVSIAISLIAAFWVLERTGTIDPDGGWAIFALLTEGGLPWLWAFAAPATLAMGLSAAVVAAAGQDGLREAAGMLTSFAMFLGLVALFTSGAWAFAVGLTAIWILALRLQSLGGAD